MTKNGSSTKMENANDLTVQTSDLSLPNDGLTFEIIYIAKHFRSNIQVI